MRNLSINLPAAVLAGVALLTSTTAWSEGDRWFRVELLAFANLTSTAPEGASLAEQWDATPPLAYPDSARFLIDPARVARNKTGASGISVLDEYGRQIISNRNNPAGNTNTATLAPAVGNPTQNEAPRPLTPVYENGAPASAPASLALPRPFVTLSGGYQEFRGKVSAMQRSGRYSVLFHETWVQPVPPEDRSLSIVLDDSGDSEQWPRLQGSIRIFLARYLQVETNLWLNTPGEYLPGTWQMPAPPFGPRTLIIEEEEAVDLTAVFDDMPDASDDASGTGNRLDATTEPAVTEPGATPIDPLGGNMAITEPVGPVYPFRHAVLLDQKRRMRSGEAHYIDHPLLGLVIKFTPISAQELDAIAQSQGKSLDNG